MSVSSQPAASRNTSGEASTARADATRNRICICCDWTNPTREMIAAYGLSTPMFHGGFSEVAANEIQTALTTLGPATNDAAGTQRHISNAVNLGHTPKFNAVMTLAKHKLIDLNRKLDKAEESMLFEIAYNGTSNERGGRFPADEYTSLADRVATMVRHGAQPNHINDNGQRPLSIAWTRTGSQGPVEIASALIAAGADPLHFDDGGVTMLHLAAGTGNMRLINNWISAGYPVAPLTQAGNGTPAMFAALENRHAALDMLVAQDDSKINLSSPFAGGTALQIAVTHGSVESVAVLLAHGANILVGFGSANAPYKKALHYGMATGDQRMTDMLLQHAVANGIPEQVLAH